MGRFVICAAVLMVAWLGAIGLAQMEITTAEGYAKVMQSSAQAFGATRKAIGSSAFADARTQLATAREGFATLQAFWTDKNREDAVGILENALTQVDTLDELLGAATVDQTAAMAAAKQVMGACGACHKLYREGDNETGYRIREGVL